MAFFVIKQIKACAINPSAKPFVIEKVTIIVIIVKKAAIPNSGFAHSISLIWLTINVPTKITAAPEIAGVINLKIGNNGIATKNIVPVIMAENPVRAPCETPVVDSTKLVTGEHPNVPPTKVPTESAIRARGFKSYCSPVAVEICVETEYNVPVVSKKSKKRKTKIEIYIIGDVQIFGFVNAVKVDFKLVPKSLKSL